MTPENFVYWLQGYLELSEDRDISSTQVQIIKDHVALVLRKQTPNRHIELSNKIQLNDFVECHDNIKWGKKQVWENGKWIAVDVTDSRFGYNDSVLVTYPDGPPASC